MRHQEVVVIVVFAKIECASWCGEGYDEP